jgi:hypothetical protein
MIIKYCYLYFRQSCQKFTSRCKSEYGTQPESLSLNRKVHGMADACLKVSAAWLVTSIKVY